MWVSSGPYLSNNAAFTVLTFLDFAGSTIFNMLTLHTGNGPKSAYECSFAGVLTSQSQVGPLTWAAIQKGQPLDQKSVQIKQKHGSLTCAFLSERTNYHCF